MMLDAETPYTGQRGALPDELIDAAIRDANRMFTEFEAGRTDVSETADSKRISANGLTLVVHGSDLHSTSVGDGADVILHLRYPHELKAGARITRRDVSAASVIPIDDPRAKF